jgi:hypothetical protein
LPDAVGVVTTTWRPAGDVRKGLGLVRVELMHAARFERGLQPRIDAFGERRVGRFDGGQPANRRDDLVRRVGPIELRARVQNLQRALEGDLLVFVSSSCG